MIKVLTLINNENKKRVFALSFAVLFTVTLIFAQGSTVVMAAHGGPHCQGVAANIFKKTNLITDNTWVVNGADVQFDRWDEDGSTVIDADEGWIIMGTAGADVIKATKLHDLIFAFGGADLICSGKGDDTIFGMGGSDTIHAGQGDDFIVGGNGNDTIHAGQGDDSIAGGKGNDTIHAGRGNDLISGGDGNDTISGGRGVDPINGGDGFDICDAGNPKDADPAPIACEA